MIVVVEVLIRTMKLRRLAALLGVHLDLSPVDSTACPLPLDDLPATTKRQMLCTRRVTDAWPFSRGPCLRRSLIAGHLLRHFHPALRLGVIGGETQQFTAHAWLEIDGRPLEDITSYRTFGPPPVGAER
ncbi:lasso peptide biosynthesis B2 protein [Ilumatobacter nonamiensis]|uniref:lasso peptide biosynthesis B2 protein n=1 Tax=Ilumatobacter nonamiensis TaxID=467093 RepID=UPI000344F8BC|nr:lasso peptide biosynthesis B2 protein [Ilumatobacter nonamiensis]